MGTRIRLRDTHENKNKNVNNTEMNAICRLKSNRLSDSIPIRQGNSLMLLPNELKKKRSFYYLKG